jgi:hypothetical protein
VNSSLCNWLYTEKPVIPDVSKSTKFWKDNGSIILILGNEAFKINHELLADSPKINMIEEQEGVPDGYDVAVIRLPEGTADPSDFTILLEDLYNET